MLTLPGVGTYTAAAVAAFAFGRRTTVVDTNIRRVHARLVIGQALPAPALTAAEMALAAELLPEDAGESVLWNAAVMELGAVICTARSPKCDLCPVLEQCAWIAAGQPEPTYIPKGQPWAGTDRQVRGAVMAVLRAASSPVHADLFWDPAAATHPRRNGRRRWANCTTSTPTPRSLSAPWPAWWPTAWPSSPKPATSCRPDLACRDPGIDRRPGRSLDASFRERYRNGAAWFPKRG